MTKQARIRGLKYLLVTAVPALVALLQCTVGEASLPVYITMAVPALIWTVIPLTVTIYAAIKRRRLWAIVNFALLLAIVFIQAGYCLGIPKIAYGPTLRVMTFNLQIFNNYDIEKVANAIRNESPDVVCFQEMPTTGKEQEFANLLKGYAFASAGRLTIASRLPITRVDRRILRKDARRALIAEIRFHGKPIRVINVHMQHFPSDDLGKAGEASRNLMVEISALERVTADAALPTILAGDLNSNPQGRVNRMLRSRLTDCFAATSRGYGYTLPAIFPLRRIDYIYAGFGFVPSVSKVANTVASDHRAVVADVTLHSARQRR